MFIYYIFVELVCVCVCLCVPYRRPHFWTELHQNRCVGALTYGGGHEQVGDAFSPLGGICRTFKMADPHSAYIICVRNLSASPSISPRIFKQSQPNLGRVLQTSRAYLTSLARVPGENRRPCQTSTRFCSWHPHFSTELHQNRCVGALTYGGGHGQVGNAF